MKINLKARLKNKTFVVSAAALIVSFVYQLLAMFDVVARVSETEVMEITTLAINVLALLGVIIDPTTDGVSDSERALTYCTENDVRCTKITEEAENK